METKKILVVDDEKGICDNVRKILTKENYEVTQAFSARDALELMANESYSLLISDILMPGKNGLELLKLVKEQWPLTKVIIMTAYASTDTAMKAIRLGALDYIPKPFTPKEVRETVDKVLSGELQEMPVSEKVKKTIDVIDLDIPFDRQEVAEFAGEAYADTLGPSDMPVVEMPSPETLEYYCAVGHKVCEIFKKLGATCKAGLKANECPQAKHAARAKEESRGEKTFDPKKLVGIDQPFSYEEVASITGPEYLMHLQGDGVVFVPYEELKEKMALAKRRQVMDVVFPLRAPRRVLPPAMAAERRRIIDVDIPFTRDEVTGQDILVIDDEAAVNNNIRKILTKKGFTVDQAMTKEEALRSIQEKAYRLVLLDLRIPGVQGLELLQTIRKKSPQTPVVIITGYASIETAKESARLGAVDYLPKPFTPDEIRKVTENAVRLAA
ncbi:MAG: response regulator [Deltaproteobacteria bacterium]|nr:response regulator [Deltaproteobacteria bacterium]